jgi:hypothetical protein
VGRDGRHVHRIQLKKEARSAFVLSLESEGKVYDVDSPPAVDDALELAAPLNYGAPGPAVSGGWAAIEALLTTPSDADDGREGRGAVAADRMAALVTASWPRGELTTLSHRHKPGLTALRTAAPLIGAGLDRITHASLVEGVDALQLAARAQLNIDLIGGDDARHLVNLLEP